MTFHHNHHIEADNYFHNCQVPNPLHQNRHYPMMTQRKSPHRNHNTFPHKSQNMNSAVWAHLHCMRR